MERHERSAFSAPVAGKEVRASFDGGRLTTDAGVLLLAGIEGRLGIAERLAAASRTRGCRSGCGTRSPR